ncbi:hypothetical protein GCK72_005265 [Caenorhabditis remanei]|uniref:Uncharacterized protein n=1 Tax=Caenorhabditis remanei TaxID=31234 RepID=A0A6A5HG18_CAERE|nr:hypothetical protein GCK72_005265 [Caenorhabditis remanei]KAF1765313.1 hypothetical protein GCK72_005265 [Caenorhabditis remanei]
MMSSSESQRNGIKLEIEQLQTYEQNCLQGLANYEKTFQDALKVSPGSSEQLAEQTSKAAMISTYTFLYVKSLKEEKMMELEEMNKKMRNQKTSDGPSESQDEFGNNR